jgi:hypothetical protein
MKKKPVHLNKSTLRLVDVSQNQGTEESSLNSTGYLVRMCCDTRCKIPNRIFGCTNLTGEAFYCEDCASKSFLEFVSCLVRKVIPLSSHVTHGLCRKCADNIGQRRRLQKVSKQA